VSTLLQNGAFVYVCGDAKYMAKEVGQALVDIISDGSSISRDEAGGKVKSMRLAGRYQEDIWA
jgi:NADPH-ferrihemoprotein reductase